MEYMLSMRRPCEKVIEVHPLEMIETPRAHLLAPGKKEAAYNKLEDLDVNGPISTIRFASSLDTAATTQTIASTLSLRSNSL
jgi:hypothetical protein